MKTFWSMLAVVLGSLASMEAADWVSLVPDDNLEGWVQRGGSAEYEVEDGVIVGTAVSGSGLRMVSRWR